MAKERLYKVVEYGYDELSDEAKGTAFEHYTNTLMEYYGTQAESVVDEAVESIKKFEETFDCKFKYEINGDGTFRVYRCDANTNFDYYEIEGMSLLRFRTWLINNYYKYTVKGRYFSNGGRWVDDGKGGKKFEYKHRYSKVILQRNACPFTGVDYDNDLLSVFYEFIDNPTKWESEYRGADDPIVFFETLMKECLEGLLKSVQSEIDELYTKECFEEFEAHEITYNVDGTQFLAPPHGIEVTAE